MKIFIDDGSTNIKLAWLEDGDVKTLISPNSFKPEWSFSLLDDAAPANYEIDGEKFSFDPLSAFLSLVILLLMACIVNCLLFCHLNYF